LGNRDKGVTNGIVVGILRIFNCPEISAKAKSFKAREAREIDLIRCNIKPQRYYTIA